MEVMNGQKPKNNVQKFAQENRGIEDQAEFQRAISVKPWKVGRLTARNWWLGGVTKGMRLGGVITLADFLKVKIDDLVEE
jgi:hypothetical protein